MSDLEDSRQTVTAYVGRHLENADQLQGEDPSEPRKRTRQQLVEEFAEPVGRRPELAFFLSVPITQNGLVALRIHRLSLFLLV